MTTYRSPLRPLELSWLPPDVRESFDFDYWFAQPEHVRTNLQLARYRFGLPLPDRFVSQWSLEVCDG